MELENLFGEENKEDKNSQEGVILKSLEMDLKLYNDSIKEVAIEIMVEGISAYPIFIAHQHEVSLGELILNKNELNTTWSIQASTLEEFIERGIISADKREYFIKNYKKAHDFMCLFVIVPAGANFVFFPYH